MPRGMSLHIGLNAVDPQQYQGWPGSLNACESDAHDMNAIASAAGFSTRLLLTAEATSSTVLDALQAVAAELTEGDTLLLTYSGHGGQIPDTRGDEEDSQDETWVLYDRQVLDDELYAAYRAFAAGVRVAVLSDSCHSGSVTRMGPPVAAGTVSSLAVPQSPISLGARSKAMPAAVSQRDFLRRREMYGALRNQQTDDIEPAACVALISGCQDNQLSLDGTYNGLFTATLLTVWNGGQFRGGYRRLRNRIAARMPENQTPRFSFLGPDDGEFLDGKPFTT
jgi:hypothetical protein